MKKYILYFITLFIALFVFMNSSNAMVALCRYHDTDSGSGSLGSGKEAYILLDGAKRSVVTNFVDESAANVFSFSLLSPIQSVKNALNYLPQNANGSYMVFDFAANYDYATYRSFMGGNADAIAYKIEWYDEVVGESQMKESFIESSVCPDYLIYDVDLNAAGTALTVVSGVPVPLGKTYNIYFAETKDAYTGFDKYYVFEKDYDLVNGVFQSNANEDPLLSSTYSVTDSNNYKSALQQAMNTSSCLNNADGFAKMNIINEAFQLKNLDIKTSEKYFLSHYLSSSEDGYLRYNVAAQTIIDNYDEGSRCYNNMIWMRDDYKVMVDNAKLFLDQYENIASLRMIEDVKTCEDVLGEFGEYVQIALNFIQYLGPILVIVLSIVDYITALCSADNDMIKKVNKKTIIRLIAVFLLFFVPLFISWLLQIFKIAGNCGLK